MNWKEISERYPKAFYELLIWLTMSPDFEREFAIDLLNGDDEFKKSPCEYFKHNYLTAYEDFPWNYRNLYDFFDEQKIYINIYFNTYEKVWDWDIVEMYHNGECGGEGLNREDIEEAAFLQAFKILEEKLNGQKEDKKQEND